MNRVAVLGAGTMGHGIAQVAAMAGSRVVLYDVSADAVENGLARIRANLDKGVAKEKVSSDLRDQTIARLSGETGLEAAAEGADLVIEAAPEVMDLKIKLFREAAGVVGPNAILASNTSSLSITRIAASLPDPTRFIGLHFFNPVHIMTLVEVVWGEETSRETIDTCLGWVARIGKDPIVVKDSPGFASSRLGIILGLEAIRMVEEGVASPSDIDKAMTLGYRHPMGPLRLTDLVGLDVRLGIAEYLRETLQSEAFAPPTLLKEMVTDGRLGKKSGQGFYTWEAS